jgi:mRNA interferase HicA
VKRDELVRQLEQQGCVLLRHGGRHDIYHNPAVAQRSAKVSRHRRGLADACGRRAAGLVAVVTILAREADETFEVPPELEAELLESIAQADRGETISAGALLERLRGIA